MKQGSIHYTELEAIQTQIKTAGFAWIKSESCLIDPQLRPDQADISHSWGNLHGIESGRGSSQRVGQFELKSTTLTPIECSESEQAHLDSPSLSSSFLQALIYADFEAMPLTNVQRKKAYDVVIRQHRVVGTRAAPGEASFIREGSDFIAIHLIQRHNVKGGQLSLHSEDGETIEAKTLVRSMDSLLISDASIAFDESEIDTVNRLEPAIRDFLIIEFFERPETKQSKDRPKATERDRVAV